MLRWAVWAAAGALAAAAPPPLPIGCNVAGMSYYDQDVLPCDLVKMGSEFGVPGGPWQGAAPIDDSGWPSADFSIIAVDVSPLLWTEMLVVIGPGKPPTISGVACNVAVLNSTYDPASDSFSTFLQPNTPMVTLAFTGTAGGLSNFSIWRTQCGAPPAPSAVTSTVAIAPAYLAHISARCSVLRMMDFQETNNNNASAWGDRVPLTWPQWVGSGSPAHGAPIEVVAEIANLAAAGGVTEAVWVNVPALADDDYVTQMATQLRDRLAPNLTVYVEFANEVWNGQFEQFHWQVAIANASVLQQGDPLQLDFDKCGNVYYWQYRLTAYQAAVRLPALFAAVFGPGSVGPNQRVRPVLAGQVADITVVQEGLRYLEAIHGPPGALLHSIAGAPYFNCDAGPGGNAQCAANSAAVSVDTVLAAVTASVADMDPSAGWGRDKGVAAHATLAAWYRFFLQGYEGGTDFSAYGLNYTITGAAQSDPRYAQVVQDYFLGWAKYGTNGPLNHFTAGASDFSTQFGCWGLVTDISLTSSPKLSGFDAARTALRSDNGLGVLPTAAGTTISAGYFAGCNCNATSATTHFFDVGEWQLYPVNLAGVQPGAQLLVTLSAQGGGTIEAGLNGGRLVNATLPTSTVPFTLTADDVAGAFGGASALRLRSVSTAGSTGVANITFAL